MSGERGRSEWRRLLEIAALCGFVVAQPVLDVFGRSLDTFVFRDAGAFDVVLFAAVVSLLPPAAVGLLLAATGLAGESVRRRVQVAAVGLGFALLTLQVVRHAGELDAAPSVALAVAAGGGLAVAYARLDVVGLWLRFASPAPLLFAALFLFVAPTSKLVVESEIGPADVAVDDAAPPIVMLVLDELPTATLLDSDGHIDERLFPSFARLAATSTWWPDFTTVNNQTWYAVPSLLSGRLPDGGRAPVAGDYPENLFTLLGGVYEVRATESITRLCPDSVCHRRAELGGGGVRGLLRDAARVWADVTRPGGGRDAVSTSLIEETAEEEAASAEDFRPSIDVGAAFSANVPARFATFLDRLDTVSPGRRTFDYVHLMLPHEAWRYYPSGRVYAVPDGGVGRVDGGDRWEDSPRAVELGRQRHLLQAVYTDALLGRLLDRLDELGTLDETLLVVVSDHGIGFRPGLPARALEAEPATVAPDTLPELAWTTLFVKAPGQTAGRVDGTDVQLVDVMPTIADLLGVEIPWEVDGVSAFAGGARPAKSITKATEGFYGPSVGPAEPIDAEALRPLVRERSTGRFLAGAAPLDGNGDSGDGEAAAAVYRAGEHGALVGLRVEELDVGPAAGRDATVDGLGEFEDVALDGEPLPGLVTGALTGEGDAVVAIALDGRVAGVSATFPDRGRAGSFAAILPDTFFREGRNELSLYLVEGAPGAEVLRPVALD